MRPMRPTAALPVMFASLLAAVAARGAPSVAPASSAAPDPPPAAVSSGAASSPAPAPGEPADEPFGDHDRVRIEGSGMALMSAGLMPRVGFGGGLTVGLRWRWLTTAVEGRVLRTPDFDYAPDRAASVLLAMGVLSACRVYPHELSLHLYSIDVCLLIGAGRMKELC